MMRTIRTRLKLACLACAVFTLVGLSSAQAQREVEPGMPNPPNSPTEVKVGIFLADIINLDELNETFEAELILTAEWNDPRLAFDPAEAGVPVKLFQGTFQFNEIYSAWWPQLLFVNQIGSGEYNAIKISIYPDGRVRYLDQRSVLLETPMDLQAFPFDVQKLEASIVSFGDYSDEVKLVVDERVLGASEEYAEVQQKVNIAQWKLRHLDLKAGEADFSYYGSKKAFSELTLVITMERKSANMIWKVILPLIILVLLMWAVFWLEADNLSDRLNVAFIGILTIVAYQFLIDGSMPRIDYFTFTDAVLLYSFVVMCLAIFESLLLYSLCKNGHRPLADKLDHVFRWFFPIVYFIGLIVSYFVYN
ncbi:hypothetical protein H5P28_10335 [Ruficoccus amylovorans]|uniref:Neurotransmitter-gated ion-channel ligand-binding domain-containing protein n=1 Tax=Ruficoccus amylovorans TaxID=1804625 RepID=A0A842HGG1_9BACT|nr:hypothetical protein [Ruficoccus amylovorans]MBC2594657.1 hypothetical protein [Ruficoccus amylovorans]